MKRTIDIMTTARANGVELPAEWFERRCPDCGSLYFACDCLTDPVERYIGPDLERAENICHAFTVADALADWPVDVRYTVGKFEVYFFSTLDTGEVKIGRGTAPERHLALIAACEAALGIERGEAGV